MPDGQNLNILAAQDRSAIVGPHEDVLAAKDVLILPRESLITNNLAEPSDKANPFDVLPDGILKSSPVAKTHCLKPEVLALREDQLVVNTLPPSRTEQASVVPAADVVPTSEADELIVPAAWAKQENTFPAAATSPAPLVEEPPAFLAKQRNAPVASVAARALGRLAKPFSWLKRKITALPAASTPVPAADELVAPSSWIEQHSAVPAVDVMSVRPAEALIALLETRAAEPPMSLSVMEIRNRQEDFKRPREEMPPVYREDRVRFGLELWAQHYNDRRQENPVQFLLAALEATPTLWRSIDKAMSRWEMRDDSEKFSTNPAYSGIPSPTHGYLSQFHDLAAAVRREIHAMDERVVDQAVARIGSLADTCCLAPPARFVAPAAG